MKPLEPLQSMAPLRAMSKSEAWWDDSLGSPDATGSQHDLQYAYFAATRRLLLRRGDTITGYDTANHHILGVSQSSDAQQPRFTTDHGDIDLTSLTRA